ncbi:MAG: hypothetical protein JWO86_6785 [Myxococcaceae bacterium]|nr:hypothetical protein [Myxococcaceae bacterium]MEA2753524.1 hypothetical protein [Myxococcales bacterium]
MTTAGVDFFRVDRSGTTTKLLVSGVLLVTTGASAIGAHLMHRLPESVSHLVSLTGGIAVIGGLVTAFGTLGMMLFENVYLTIRDEGLLIHDNGNETSVPWDELTEVVVLAPKGLVELRRGEKEPLRWFAGSAAKDVGGRIAEAKRKAAVGLLAGRQ